MTRLFALDLTGDRAALHLWEGADWHTHGTAALTDPDAVPRALAALLAPASGTPVVVLLPENQITRHPPGAVPGADPAWRTDWQDGPGGAQVAAVPLEVLRETEAFLTALGAAPAGCLAQPVPNGTGRAAWFGRSDSPAAHGRALDRPAALGLGIDAPDPWEADPPASSAARLRALAAARRDPADRAPLPDLPGGIAPRPPDARLPLRQALSVPRLAAAMARHLRSARRVAALSAVLLAILGAVLLRPEAMPEPTAMDSADAAPPAVLAAAPPTDNTDDTTDLAADEPTIEPGPEPVPADLAAMDAPDGIAEIATFYTPATVLARRVTTVRGPDLVLPGLDASFRTDALALPDAVSPPETALGARTLMPPGPPAQVLVVDENGLIRPSPEGRLAPEGYRVVTGAPPAQTRPRPERSEPETVSVTRRADLPEDDPLRRLSPRTRPGGLAERFERDRLGGKTETELAGLPPGQRPASAQQTAAAPDAAATALAVPRGPRPAARSAETLAAFRTAAASIPAEPIVPEAVQAPTAATPAKASAAATTTARLNLGEVNLLGTFGSTRSPRALVRLPSGRVVNVAVGDQVDGGQVAGIAEGRLNYVKSGRTVTLQMPRG